MRLTRLDVRFFRSFNHDYEARARGNRERPTWDSIDPWYPFVRVPIDGEITAIVGANESGKSQLLSAVKALLTGSPIERADFCRHSELYSVKAGELRLPHFGGEFLIESTDDLPSISGLPTTGTFELYRLGVDPAFLVVGGNRIELSATDLASLESALPTFYELKTNLAIPDSVSIAELAGVARAPIHDRRKRATILTTVASLLPAMDFTSLPASLQSFLQTSPDPDAVAAEARRRDEFELARSLLVDAAGIDERAFSELQSAIADGREGQVEALIGAMNSAIKENLNIQRWWTQDRDFDLLVEAREHELAFTVRDRTGSKYSFQERSQGLRYFLSYFVQLAAHRIRHAAPDLLLLDEPDAFLSSVGQQDLLRVLHDYALPESGGDGSQVVYVTHSPFLIDKNAPHRIRVLDKGVEAEGTRVVRDAANNRYEPLRSALGAYVAETAFIGGENLFVEGQADQVLLAGLSTSLAATGDFGGGLDLNDVTIVACGGADSIPYMVYLARGRDTVKPPCVALLDGDDAGQQAERVLLRGEARKKKVLSERYIVRLDRWVANTELDFGPVVVREIEDLLPISIAQRAAINYLARFADLSNVDVADFTVQSIVDAVTAADGKLWDGLATAYTAAFEGEHLEKVGLAREVVSLVAGNQSIEGASTLLDRFGRLLQHLSEVLDLAAAEEAQARGDDRLARIVRAFEKDHPTGIKKHDARRILTNIRTALSGADFPDELHGRVQRLQRDFEIDDPTDPRVPRFEEFRKQLLELRLSDRLTYQDDAQSDPASYTLEETHVALDAIEEPVSDASSIKGESKRRLPAATFTSGESPTES